jgi:ribosomal protein S18 acetylase RimI-like enzyme
MPVNAYTHTRPVNDAELANLADANYAYSRVVLAENIEGGEASESEGLVFTVTGLPSPAFNVAFVLQPLVDPARQVRDAISRFDAHQVPFQVSIRDRLDPLAERACVELGLVALDELLPGMALADLAATDGRRTPEWLRIAPVDESNVDQYVAVAARAFEAPRELISRLATPRLLAVRNVESYLGYLDDVPVASAVLVMAEGVAGIFNVATEEPYRRRGIGEAMTWHAISRGRQSGCRIAALQASRSGRSVYERMGFRVVSPYLEFRRPA